MILLKDKIKSNKGQSLVELAFVLPIVLIILFGIMEFGRIFSAYLMVSNASREGARYASIGSTDAFVVDKIEERLESLGIVQISISPSYSSRSYGDNVTVTVSHNLELMVPIIRNLISDTSSIKLESSTQMRVERE